MPQTTKAHTNIKDLSDTAVHDAERQVLACQERIRDLHDSFQAELEYATRDLAAAMQRQSWAHAMRGMAPDQEMVEAPDAGDILQEGMDEAKQNGKAG